MLELRYSSAWMEMRWRALGDPMTTHQTGCWIAAPLLGQILGSADCTARSGCAIHYTLAIRGRLKPGPPVIRLLGIPELIGISDDYVFPSKGFQLIALVGRAPSGKMTRRELAAYLWESESDSTSLANLRQLVTRMKRGLGDKQDVLEIDAQAIALGTNRFAVDLCAFEATLGVTEAEPSISALQLFRGELLEGVDDTTEAFAHWLSCERAVLREHYMTLAATALVELTRYGRASKVQVDTIAERMLALEPERESSYRAIIDAYGRSGMFDDAARVYQALQEMLAREHGVGLAPESVAVARRVFGSRWTTDGPLPRDATGSQPRVAFLAPALDRQKAGSPFLKVFVEDIANELARFRSFVMLAPHSSFDIDHDSGMPLDNSLLRADYTVSGFAKYGDGSVILALRMVNCANSEIVWSGEFHITPLSLSASFSLLSIRIASALSTAVERDRLLTLRRNGGGESYLHYLEGQRWLANCDLPRLRRARRSFTKAVDTSTRFAPPRARIAQTLYLEWIQLGGNDPYILNNAREQATLAIELDPNDAIGHWVDGTIAMYQRDFDRCNAKLAEAESLCPNSADLLIQLADAAAHLGDADAGWQKFTRAIDLNPSPPEHYWWAGASIAFLQRDFQKTIRLCSKLTNEDSVLGILGASHAYLGARDTARAYGRRIRDLFPGGAAAERAKLVPDRYERDRQLRMEGLRLIEAL
jgi:pentatricopeptide repeat protein